MGEIYINGTFIGRHENGVMAFGFDLTPYVKPYPQQNVIAVKTDNDLKYKEKSEANINQVVLKLAGWRSKKYPIRISIDNKKVFEGLTPLSLGYVTLDFQPTKGKKIQIELMATAKDSDGINLVEITGKVDQAGINKEGKVIEQLPIVEVEFYEPIR